MAKGSLIPQQQKRMLIGLGVAIGAAVWFAFLFAPQRRAWSESRLQVRQIKQQMAEFRRQQSQIPRMQGDLERLQAEYAPDSPVRPPEEQLPELLKSLNEMAYRSGVRFIGAKPTSEVNRLVPGESGYLELQVMVVVIGGYHSIASFIDTVESSPELLRVRELMVVHEPGAAVLAVHPAFFLLQACLVPAPVDHGLTGPKENAP